MDLTLEQKARVLNIAIVATAEKIGLIFVDGVVTDAGTNPVPDGPSDVEGQARFTWLFSVAEKK